jgi:acetolactate synthase-1/2/3 large subunit
MSRGAKVTVSNSITCGEYLVKLLGAYGVEIIFGIPGVHTVELYRGLPQTKIRHITPRHEQGAGFMADGYARVTGKPGVCFIVTGPGMTNIATAMGQAYADSKPMLVLSSVNARSDLGMGRGRLHELRSQRNLIEGLAAFSHTLLTPCQLPEVVARAFAIFASCRPRPVHIEIPIDLITEKVADEPPTAWPMPSRPAACKDVIARAAERLNYSERPLIIVGGGSVEAACEVKSLAERLDAPVFMTINGKGVLPAGHDLALAGNLAMLPLKDELIRSDVILAIGTEFGETEMYPEPSPVQFDGELIRIDIDPQQLMTAPRSSLAILSDAKLALTALLEKVTPRRSGTNGRDRVRGVLERIEDHWPSCRKHRRLVEAIQETLPDPIIAGDQTAPVYAVNQFYEAPQPRSYFNSSTGYGTLGYGLPAAFGAKLGAPDRPVVCLIGDGGLQFSLPELATAVDAKIGAAIVVWNNSAYAEIKDFMASKNIPQIGVDLSSPDFVSVARAIGCEAAAPKSTSEFKQALVASRSQDVPTLIEIRADSSLAIELAS